LGQQQLLLIVLGVIIVGVAVVVGINLFNAHARIAAIDSVTLQLVSYGHLAQEYYKKPKAFGGGGNSFAGFMIPNVNPAIQSLGWGGVSTGISSGSSSTESHQIDCAVDPEWILIFCTDLTYGFDNWETAVVGQISIWSTGFEIFFMDGNGNFTVVHED
jgi:hypothetical protein